MLASRIQNIGTVFWKIVFLENHLQKFGIMENKKFPQRNLSFREFLFKKMDLENFLIENFDHYLCISYLPI